MNIKNKGVLLILLTAIISGISIFINSYAVKGFDSSVFTFAKNILVAVLLFTIIIAFKEFKTLKTLTKKQWYNLVFIGLAGGSIPFLLFFKGLQMSTGSTASFIYKTLFVYATILAVLLLKEKLNKKVIIGTTLLMVGSYFMIRPVFQYSTGLLLVGIAVLFWAYENILAKKMLKDLSGTVVAWGRMFFGSVFILAFLIATGKATTIFSMTNQQYLWIVLSSALLLLYVVTYYNGLKTVSVSVATSLLAIGAPITALLSLTTGSTLTLSDALGIIFITIGILVMVAYSFMASLLYRLLGIDGASDEKR